MDQKLTIVQALPDMDEGGVEGETYDVAVYLAQQGHKSIVISAGGRLVAGLEEQGVIHYRWPGIGKKNLSCLQYIWKVRSLLLKQDVDVLHLRSRLPAWVCWLAWKSLPVAKRPGLLTTFHGFYSINCYSAIMTKGQQVIAVSDGIKKHIIENYQIDPHKIPLVYGGVDINIFSPDSVDKDCVDKLIIDWKIKKDKPVLILPGRITRLKGHEFLIKSIAKLKSLDFTLLMVGDLQINSYINYLIKLVEDLGLEEKIKFVGSCDNMPAAFSLADIVISSSIEPESFGKTVIEAMAMAKPVIATKHGGSLETVVDGVTGIHVTPGSIDDMAGAIEKLLLDSELCLQYGQNARRVAKEKFSIQAMCNETFSLYKKLSKYDFRG